MCRYRDRAVSSEIRIAVTREEGSEDLPLPSEKLTHRGEQATSPSAPVIQVGRCCEIALFGQPVDLIAEVGRHAQSIRDDHDAGPRALAIGDADVQRHVPTPAGDVYVHCDSPDGRRMQYRTPRSGQVCPDLLNDFAEILEM